ncbi:Protein of unknown function [Gryllus bimaculatus]|nr:Protein of unknown function [Gryllus bimaculatus]
MQRAGSARRAAMLATLLLISATAPGMNTYLTCCVACRVLCSYSDLLLWPSVGAINTSVQPRFGMHVCGEAKFCCRQEATE